MKKSKEKSPACAGTRPRGSGTETKNSPCSGRLKEKRGIRKAYAGSYTVELALLTPLLLLTLVGSIYIVMHFHNSASLAAGACEIAVSGKADTELAPLLFSPPAVPSISANASARSVRFDSFTLWHGGRLWGISRGATYEKARPVTAMNRLRAVKKAAGSSRE